MTENKQPRSILINHFSPKSAQLLAFTLPPVTKPRTGTRNPARNVRAERFVFRAESLAQRGFLVGQDKQVRYQPREQRVLENANVTEQQRLFQYYGDHRDIHRIANVTIKTLHHQVARRKDGRGRAQSLQRKTRKRIEHYERAGSNQQDAGHPQWRVAPERRADLPSRNPPGHQSRYAAGCEHQEERCSHERKCAAHSIIRLRLGLSGHFVCLRCVLHFSSRAQLRAESCVILRGNMSVIISMLRGVNVGGHNKIKMDQLRAVYESLGFRDAQTYIQSGNVVSRADKRDPATARTRIEKGIERNFGFRPSVIVRTASELREVIVRNPFAKRSGIDASRLLVAFLASSPAANALDKVLKIKCEPQELRVSGRELFIYFPDGMARPTLPLATVERTLKISFTGRNWNTVRKLLEMAEALEAAG